MKKSTLRTLWNLAVLPLAASVALATGCTSSDDDDSTTSSSSGGVNRSSSGTTSSGGTSGTTSSGGTSHSGTTSSGGTSGTTSSGGTSGTATSGTTSSGGTSGTATSGTTSSGGSSSGTTSSGGSSSGTTSSGGATTIESLKALIAADPNCANSTPNCQYNNGYDAGYYDIDLTNVVVVSTEHTDFDNSMRNSDGGSVKLRAIFVATNLQAASNNGIEVVAPYYYQLPAVQVGDHVDIHGSLRSNFGNTYIRALSVTVSSASAAAATPATVSVDQVGNNTKGAEYDGGGCATANAETDQAGEPWEGSLVDVDLGAGLPITYVPAPILDGGTLGVAHRLSVGNKLVVADNFGILAGYQTGTSLEGKTVTRLRGFQYYSYGCRKIQPRSTDDLIIAP